MSKPDGGGDIVSIIHKFKSDQIILGETLTDQLYQQTYQLWRKLPHENSAPNGSGTYTRFEQWANERYIKQGISAFCRLINDMAIDPKVPISDAQRDQLTLIFKTFILEAPFLTVAEKQFMSRKDFMDASLQFIEQATQSDGQIELEGLGQALRNFWIANLLQAMLGKPIENHPALYAYSMLYPYTDNLMDDPNLTTVDKQGFCQRLSLTLGSYGSSLINEALSSDELRIHELCRTIYQNYSAVERPATRFGLEWIHSAQIGSIEQQNPHLVPYELDLLYLSFNKGGASLTADALLVQPELNQNQFKFAYAFGALLQLCDDLQDTSTDANAGHMTIFSQLKDRFILDQLCNRLMAFSDALGPLAQDAQMDRDQLIEQVVIPNTQLLIRFAAISQQHLFSRSWVKANSPYLPVTSAGLNRIQRHMRRSIKQTPFKFDAKVNRVSELASFSKTAVL